jgi:hypothetical protein
LCRLLVRIMARARKQGKTDTVFPIYILKISHILICSYDACNKRTYISEDVVVQNGVVVSKLAIIDEYLKKLQGYIPVSMDQFASDWGLQKIAERSLQVMIEVMIDIAERIVAQKGMVPQKPRNF